MTAIYGNLPPVEFTFRCQGSVADGTQCPVTTGDTGGVPAGLWRCDGHHSGHTGPEWMARENARRVRDGLAPIVDPCTSPAARAGLKHGPGGRGGPGQCDPDCRKCAGQRFVNQAISAGQVHISKARREELVPTPATAPTKPDPLDVEYDGVPLRTLLQDDELRRNDNRAAMARCRCNTPAQRAAVSAHWSAQLRAKVDASAAAERELERNRVVLDQDADDLPWRTW